MVFLKVIQHEFKNKRDFKDHLKNIGFELIARGASKYPTIINELKKFNMDDKEIVKDISRFRNG